MNPYFCAQGRYVTITLRPLYQNNTIEKKSKSTEKRKRRTTQQEEVTHAAAGTLSLSIEWELEKNGNSWAKLIKKF